MSRQYGSKGQTVIIKKTLLKNFFWLINPSCLPIPTISSRKTISSFWLSRSQNAYDELTSRSQNENWGYIPLGARRCFNIYKTTAMSYRCLVDVETTLHVCWDNLLRLITRSGVVLYKINLLFVHQLTSKYSLTVSILSGGKKLFENIKVILANYTKKSSFDESPLDMYACPILTGNLVVLIWFDKHWWQNKLFICTSLANKYSLTVLWNHSDLKMI